MAPTTRSAKKAEPKPRATTVKKTQASKRLVVPRYTLPGNQDTRLQIEIRFLIARTDRYKYPGDRTAASTHSHTDRNARPSTSTRAKMAGSIDAGAKTKIEA